MVDEPAAAPLPVDELAQRAQRLKRRQRHRRSILAGLVTTAVVVVAGSLATRDTPAQVTTADSTAEHLPASSPSTTDPPTPTTRPTTPTTAAEPAGPTSSSTPGTTGTPRTSPTTGTSTEAESGSDGPIVETPGVDATLTVTSSWDGGRCVEIRVENTTESSVTWTVSYDPGATIDTTWNAVVGDDGHTFTGESWNASLSPGEWTTFGVCAGQA